MQQGEQKKTNPHIITVRTLRVAVGVMGMTLPFVVVMLSGIFGGCDQLLDTISHYYFSAAGDVFVGILCAVALFFFSYQGYEDDRRDRIATNIAAVGALCVALSPTNPMTEPACEVIFFNDNSVRAFIHYGGATVLFCTLAFISYFLFTKSKGDLTNRKLLRNRIYRWCAVIMVLSVVAIGLIGWLEHRRGQVFDGSPVFWLETLALVAFGISWFIKGETLFRD
ncbi:MAG: hypothetical protein JNM00_08970 [Flavobacteriales bacterium]|nr:hypothetical protein [Flavobacteriales bacterium]